MARSLSPPVARSGRNVECAPKVPHGRNLRPTSAHAARAWARRWMHACRHLQPRNTMLATLDAAAVRHGTSTRARARAVTLRAVHAGTVLRFSSAPLVPRHRKRGAQHGTWLHLSASIRVLASPLLGFRLGLCGSTVEVQQRGSIRGSSTRRAALLSSCNC